MFHRFHLHRHQTRPLRYTRTHLTSGTAQPLRRPPPLLEFALLSPAHDSTLVARDFAVLVDIAVAEPANLFQERHKDSRVCFELRRSPPRARPSRAHACAPAPFRRLAPRADLRAPCRSSAT